MATDDGFDFAQTEEMKAVLERHGQMPIPAFERPTQRAEIFGCALKESETRISNALDHSHIDAVMIMMQLDEEGRACQDPTRVSISKRSPLLQFETEEERVYNQVIALEVLLTMSHNVQKALLQTSLLPVKDELPDQLHGYLLTEPGASPNKTERLRRQGRPHIYGFQLTDQDGKPPSKKLMAMIADKAELYINPSPENNSLREDVNSVVPMAAGVDSLIKIWRYAM